MKAPRERTGSAALVPELVARALGEIAGAALVLDDALRVVAATPAADALLAGAVTVGVSASRLLCGESVERPVAEALAAGRPVTATVPRPGPRGERSVRVRALPLPADGPGASRARKALPLLDGDAGDRPRGWLLLLDEEAGGAPEDAVEFHGLWTRDPAMKRLFRVVERVARSEASVLVRGETGAGKELIARAVHALSPRARGPFRAINCAALPPTLLESELFGHVRGAFTGAVRDNPGHFRSAEGGTLFLDEVGEMPVDVQAKLLRVVETRTVIPVGASEAVPVDVRIVAATHRSLRAEVEAGRFRADLMYRLRVIPVFLPPLRARPGDVLLIADRIVDEMNRRGDRHVERIADGARAALSRHGWPGNVRELRNALEYAFAVGDGPVLLETDLPPEIALPGLGGDELAPRANRPPSLEPAPPEAPHAPLPESSTAEAQRIRRALERAGGNRDRAARSLGMSRATLWRRMRALQLLS